MSCWYCGKPKANMSKAEVIKNLQAERRALVAVLTFTWSAIAFGVALGIIGSFG